MFAKYDPKGTGSLDVHNFVVRLISPIAEPEPWFRDRATYEFHVLNRAPMKKVSRMKGIQVAVYYSSGLDSRHFRRFIASPESPSVPNTSCSSLGDTFLYEVQSI